MHCPSHCGQQCPRKQHQHPPFLETSKPNPLKQFSSSTRKYLSAFASLSAHSMDQTVLAADPTPASRLAPEGAPLYPSVRLQGPAPYDNWRRAALPQQAALAVELQRGRSPEAGVLSTRPAEDAGSSPGVARNAENPRNLSRVYEGLSLHLSAISISYRPHVRKRRCHMLKKQSTQSDLKSFKGKDCFLGVNAIPYLVSRQDF